MSSGAAYTQALQAFRANRLADAMRQLETLLRCAPTHADGWNLAGVISNMRGDFQGAVACFGRAAEFGTGPGAWVNLGFALQKLGRLDAAEQAYCQALDADPTLALAWQKLGGLRELQGDPMGALDALRRASALEPADTKSLGDALMLRRQLADWSERDTPTPASALSTFARAQTLNFAPLLLQALPEADPIALRAIARTFAWSQWHAQLRAPPLVARAQPREGRRLRIGYLSSDFRDHAVSYLVLEAIAAHDRSTVEVVLYSCGPNVHDVWRALAVSAADRFVDVGPLDDHAAARCIADDGIDVLVSLNGYTGHARLGIVALRPAPVVVSWLGYIGSLGEPRLADYVIGDAFATPLETATHFSETLAWMPRCFQPNAALGALPPALSREAEGLPDAAVVFCSFNQTFKLHPALWDDWCAILAAVPAAVLWLAPTHPGGQRNLRREAERRGIDPWRLVFAGQRPRSEHIARLELADVALDTWPYNSGTTASDVLRAGVPLLTVPGDRFVSRMAASLLHAAGLDECVHTDRAALVAHAIRLGLDAALRRSLRRRVGEARDGSTLFNPAAFARDLERLYAAMHDDACAGRRRLIRLDAPDDRRV